MSTQIIRQENDAILSLITQLDDCQRAWADASTAWETEPTDASGTALEQATKNCQQVEHEIALHIRSLFQAGYRLQ
jgi:hypothetical protein